MSYRSIGGEGVGKKSKNIQAGWLVGDGEREKKNLTCYVDDGFGEQQII